MIRGARNSGDLTISVVILSCDLFPKETLERYFIDGLISIRLNSGDSGIHDACHGILSRYRFQGRSGQKTCFVPCLCRHVPEETQPQMSVKSIESDAY